MTTQHREVPEGWYHAEGDPPGTSRYWNGDEWVGDPVAQDATGEAPGPDVPSSPEPEEVVAGPEPGTASSDDEVFPSWDVVSVPVSDSPAIRDDVVQAEGTSAGFVEAGRNPEPAETLDPVEPLATPMASPSPAVASTPPALSTPPARSRRGTTIALAVLALLVVAGGIGWALAWLTDSSTETETAAVSDDATSDEGTDTGADLASADSEGDALDPASPTVDESADSDDAATADEADETDSTADSADGEFVVPETPDNPSGAAQYTVMADNKAYMRGWYPNAELAQGAVEDAAVIMGGIENVVDETQIDPRVEIQPETYAVYFENYVLFESDSAEVASDFYEFLGYPLFFMMNNADATVTVVAYTDARGSADYNLDLATRRAEAVRDFWLANGGNAEQIILDPRGEEGADADASDEEAQLDRRVELVVSGFLPG